MSVLKSVKSFDLFRCLVVPSLFLCVIFHHPAFQWIAVGGLAIWLGFVLVGICAAAIKKQQVVQKKAPEISDKAKADDASPACMTPEGELLLIRQINSRITEQLKGTYPAVSWLWVKRPTVDEFCKGGVWRIQVSIRSLLTLLKWI